MPDKNKEERINPRIKSVDIGILNLRKIKVYPLSMHDQLGLTRTINKALETFFQLDDKEGDAGKIVFAGFMIKLIQDNIKLILKLICPDEDVVQLQKEMDNNQLSEIVKIVYLDNYEQPVKNVTSLFPKEQIQSLLKRQSQQSVSDMDTNLTTSIEEALEKEA